MNIKHLSTDRLEPGATPGLSDEEQRHLSGCPRCRVESRLLLQFTGEVSENLPGLKAARQSFSVIRSSIMMGFSTHTHVMDEADSARSAEEVLAQVPEKNYDTLGPIGVGGMGEVWRVHDQRLHRQVAMKWLKSTRMGNARVVERFVQEARVTAQLQHPGIVPVHEFGRLPDGRPYFTMKEVQGRTLGDVAAEVHDASTWGLWMAGPSGWTFRRLVDTFHRVCEAVAYAHSQGVVHRDLKPANIMVGAYGEVQVLDWGLAKVLDSEGPAVDPLSVEPDEEGAAQDTRVGSIVGTLPYMPPEQALGRLDQVGPRSDVYALGATLYHILTGRPPYVGSPEDVIANLGAGLITPISDLLGELALPPVPDELVRICDKAMARVAASRYADAAALAADVAAWLDGARRREQALALVEQADGLRPEMARLKRHIRELNERLAGQRRNLAPDAPLEKKRPIWAIEDKLASLKDRAAVAEVEHLKLLRASLTYEPTLPEAHERLAGYHRFEHANAEAARDRAGARRHEIMLRAHGESLFADYLVGDGTLSLTTTPPGAKVVLHSLGQADRRMVVVSSRNLGVTPLVAEPVAMGSYLAEITSPGCETVTYPVHIRRQEQWHGREPGASRPQPIPLPAAEALGGGEVYVPAGWSFTGGDDGAHECWPGRWVWIDGFVMQTHPITNADYIGFLNDLVEQGRGEEAANRAPRERAGPLGERGAIIYVIDENGRYALGADADADTWHPQWPVMMASWHDACAFAQWLSAKSGQSWRLPHELEWEKAARGVDGRSYPWGDYFEPLYACMRDSPPGRRSPAVVGDYVTDVSPYGVRGMAGNMGDWCLNAYDDPPPVDGSRLVIDSTQTAAGPKAKRGGAWQHDAQVLRVTERHGLDPDYHSFILGFRLVRDL